MRQASITTMMQAARMVIPVIAAISVTTSIGSVDLDLSGRVDLGVTGKVVGRPNDAMVVGDSDCTNEDDPVMINTEDKQIG